MIGASDICHASILVVDDQAANVALLEQMLRGAGYWSVASTRDPHEVCELHQPGHKVRALQTGAKDFISTPFDLAEVLMRVRNMPDVRLLHVAVKTCSTTLEQTVLEVEASREVVRRQSDEVRSLYDQVVIEQIALMDDSSQLAAHESLREAAGNAVHLGTAPSSGCIYGETGGKCRRHR